MGGVGRLSKSNHLRCECHVLAAMGEHEGQGEKPVKYMCEGQRVAGES
jgi:hypothetical protein